MILDVGPQGFGGDASAGLAKHDVGGLMVRVARVNLRPLLPHPRESTEDGILRLERHRRGHGSLRVPKATDNNRTKRLRETGVHERKT